MAVSYRNEVRRGLEFSELTGIISEEDTTKGSEGTDQIGLDGDGRFDAGHVGGARDNNTSSHLVYSYCHSLEDGIR